MKSYRILIAGACAASLAACGTTTDTVVDAGTTVDAGTVVDTKVEVAVSGVAASHAINAIGLAAGPIDFTSLGIGVVNPETVIANPDAAPLGQAALDTGETNCAGGYCAWTFAKIDIQAVNLGLVAVLKDLRTTDPKWVSTGTGIASAATIVARKGDKAAIADVKAFAITKAATAKLAEFLSAVRVAGGGTAITKETLEANGFLVGNVVGKKAESYAPVAGATVTAGTAAGAAPVDIYYPNATFSSVGASTSANGMFIAVPKAAAAVVASWSVTKPAEDTRTWKAATAGTSLGTAFVLLFAAED